MKYFLGTYSPSLTEGSRIILPKKHRENIQGDEVILSKGFEGCVFVYGAEDWLDLVQNRIEKRRGQKNLEEFERYIFPSAVEASIDIQGRIVLPANLLEHAGIEKNAKEVMVIGVGDHIEIWNKSKWDEYEDRVSKKMESDA